MRSVGAEHPRDALRGVYDLTYPAMRAGGMIPDLWNDVGYWRSPVWPFAQQAVLAYLRIAADRTGAPVAELVELLQRA